MRLWSSLIMQNIRAKQAEEKWNLNQYTFLAGRCKIVPLACRLEDWVYIPTQSSRWLPPVVKATVRIFSSRTGLRQSFSFHTACLVPKILFSATSSLLNGKDMLYLHNLATLLSLRCEWRFRSQLNNCWKIIDTTFCSLWYRMPEYILIGRWVFIGH